MYIIFGIKIAAYNDIGSRIFTALKYLIMKNVFIILSGLVLVQLCACQKQSSHPHEPIDSLLVQNFNYKVGTYWIYKDSLTNEKDSFFVTDNTFSSANSSSNSQSLTDLITINISQSNSNSIKAKWSLILSHNVMDCVYNGSISIQYNDFIYVPFTVGLLGYNEEDSGFVISVNNTDTVNSNYYSSVVKFKHINDAGTVFPHFDNTFYFNMAAGIIKMELNQDTHYIWELQQYKIIK